MTADEALNLLASTFTEERPTASMADLRAELLTSPDAFVWRGERSAVFLRLEETSTGERVCVAAPAAGDLGEILDRATADVETFARENGCTQIRIQAGREGWAKALAPFGYEMTAILLRKLL